MWKSTQKMRRQSTPAALPAAAQVLELRVLPAATASFANGVLDVQGTEGSDQIILYQDGTKLKIDGVTITQPDGTATTPSLRSVKSIVINARGGNDLVWVGTGITASTKAVGGAGADVFVASPTTLLTRDSDATDRLVISNPGSIWAQMEAARSASGVFTLGRVTLGSVVLDNVRITISANRLQFQAGATLPILGVTELIGSAAADLSDYTLGSKPGTVTFGKFTLSNASASLTEKGLTFKGTADLALVGKVTFEGAVPAKGEPLLTATLGNIPVLGGLVTLNKPTLTLKQDQAAIHVDAVIANLGKATFDGSIGFDGSYELKAVASVNVAGIQVNGVNLTLGSSKIDALFTVPVPSIGKVTFGGSYGPNGWSVTGTYPGIVTIGPVVLKQITVTVAVDKVAGDHFTVAALATIASINGIVDAKATVTIFKDGRTDLKVDARTLAVGSFSLGSAIVTVSNNNSQKLYVSTLNGYVGFDGGPTVNVSGVVDAKGNYSLTGSETIDFGGVKFAGAQITLTKSNGMSFNASLDMAAYRGKVTGTATADGHVQFQGSGGVSTRPNGFSLSSMTVKGDLNRPAETYTMHLEGTSNVLVGTFRFAADVSGKGSSFSSPTFQATGAIAGLLQPVLSGTATFTMESTRVRFQGNLAVNQLGGFKTAVSGTVEADGTINISYQNSSGQLVKQQFDKTGRIVREWVYYDAGHKLLQFRTWASSGLTKVQKFNQAGGKILEEFFGSSGKWVSQQFDGLNHVLQETRYFGAAGSKIYQIRNYLADGTYAGFSEFNSAGGQIARQWLTSSSQWISQTLDGANHVIRELRYFGKYGSQLQVYMSLKSDGTWTEFGEFASNGIQLNRQWLVSSGNWVSQNLDSSGHVVAEWVNYGGRFSNLKQYGAWTASGKLTALTRFATDGKTKTFEAYFSTTGNWVEKTYKNGVELTVKVWNSAGKYLGDALKNYSDGFKKFDPTTQDWWPF